MAWLQEILGEAYSAETEEKVNAYIGKTFVSRSDFNAKNSELKKALEASGSKKAEEEDYKALYDELKQTAEKTQAEQSEKYNKYRLTEALKSAKAKDAKLVQALLDSGKLDFADETAIKGLDDQIKAAQTSHPYLFDIPAPAKGTGAPAGGEPPAAGSKQTPTVW